MRFLKSNLREQFFGTFLRTEFGILFFFVARILKNSAKNCLKNSAKVSEKMKIIRNLNKELN